MIALVVTKFFLLFLLVSFLLVIVTELAGKFASSRLRATASNSYFIPQTQLFDFVRNPASYPNWRNGIKEVQHTANTNQWKEIFGKSQFLSLDGRVAHDGSQVFQAESTGKNPFSFNRTYTVYQKDKLAYLKIEDRLYFRNPALRLYANTFYDHSKILHQELKNIDVLLS